MSPDRSRRVYIDWARGLAVLLMIAWHTVDAWTRAADRGSLAFGRALILGGFAAPLFLWLAGLGVALTAARVTAVSNRRTAVATVVRRGLEIFILAFLFRLQAFLVSPGSDFVTVFRVDILNIMGPAIVLTGLIWMIAGRCDTPRAPVVAYAAAAATVALVTPMIRTLSAVDRLPLALQWYLRPAGDLTTFTMFPWAGFVFAGAACGVLLASSPSGPDERRAQGVFALTGATLLVAGRFFSTQPSIYRESWFWTTSPTWFAMRVGVLMVGVAILYAAWTVAARWNRSCPWLERFGRSSLFVYWIHVELVYGYSSWLLRGRLPIWASFLAFVAFSALMFGAIVARDRVLEYRSASRRQHPSTLTVTA